MTQTNYLQQLAKARQVLEFDPKFCHIFDQMQETVSAYQKHRLPARSLPELKLTEVDFVRLMTNKQFLPQDTWVQKQTFLTDLARFLDDFRQFIQQEYGVWAMINQQMMTCWQQQFPHLRYLELMAGNASLSWALRQQKQAVIATDDFSWSQQSQTGHDTWTSVISMDALTALNEFGHQVDVVLLSWSPDRELIDWQLLQELRSWVKPPQFWVIGEYKGATNSMQFWQRAHLDYDARLMKINQYYRGFDLVKDHLFLVR
ncbi:hypothetical protein MOO45_04595 [Bombilactobacillus folatiphilus]|uniref:SAM-dependent methyltransferase n=1 Tax=Bombilactobacillus folatiphilus TaxID=2923362 RepID=A0ABY4P778_9LACO|nr:hypothetical protein [Bombilactobacillus folatiphilus]UQS81507.1 hypothetical protein MOO45_04595 [Bombilactobacillus folatiphilus]